MRAFQIGQRGGVLVVLHSWVCVVVVQAWVCEVVVQCLAVYVWGCVAVGDVGRPSSSNGDNLSLRLPLIEARTTNVRTLQPT